MKNILFTLFFFILLINNAFPQQIKGTVTYNGEPMIGAVVLLRDTICDTCGTVTDIDGKYVLNVSEGQHTLEFSYIGLQTISKIVDVKRGETIVFDTIMTQGWDCFEVEAFKIMDICHYAFMRSGGSDFNFFTNNYIKYSKNDVLAVGIHFQPEIWTEIRRFQFLAMCDMLYLYNDDSKKNEIKPHFRVIIGTNNWYFNFGYNKNIDKKSMPEQLFSLEHYFLSKANDGFSIYHSSICQFFVWMDCVDNNLFNQKWNKDVLWGLSFNKNFYSYNFWRNIRLYADVLYTNHSYIPNDKLGFAKNLQSGMYGITFNILHYHPIYLFGYLETPDTKPKDHEFRVNSIFYELKYAQSHFFDDNTGFDNTSGNGIMNRIVFNTKNNFLFDLGYFYAKDYVSTYSDAIYNCFEVDNSEISVISFGAQYSLTIGSYYSAFNFKMGIHTRFYKDILNDRFTYSAGINLIFIPKISF